MIKAVRVSALAVMSAFLLTGAVFASDTPPAPPPAPMQGDAAPPPPEVPPAPPAPQTTEKDPLDEIVCKRVDAASGSRLGTRKECKTRRQWRDERRDEPAADVPGGSSSRPGGAN